MGPLMEIVESAALNYIIDLVMVLAVFMNWFI